MYFWSTALNAVHGHILLMYHRQGAVHKRRHPFFKIFDPPPPLSSNVYIWGTPSKNDVYFWHTPSPRKKISYFIFLFTIKMSRRILWVFFMPLFWQKLVSLQKVALSFLGTFQMTKNIDVYYSETPPLPLVYKRLFLTNPPPPDWWRLLWTAPMYNVYLSVL